MELLHENDDGLTLDVGCGARRKRLEASAERRSVSKPAWPTIAPMAEVRKFKPGQSAISEAIEKAMGQGVRPVTPGGSRDPNKTYAAQPAAATITASTFLVSDEFLTPASRNDTAAQDDGSEG